MMQHCDVDPALFRGAIELEATPHGVRPHRLPAWARRQCPDPQLAMVEAQPAGVRLVFRTTATALELDTVRTRREYVGAPARPDGIYDLLVDGQLLAQASGTGGHLLTIDMARGTVTTASGPAGTVRFAGLPAGPKLIELWLPYNEATEIVGLRSDAPITPVPATGPVWLHHGSSISHGTDAASPSATWPAVAAALSRLQLVNLGFGGSALLDPFLARVMRDTPADVISLKIGINLVNLDLMRQRALAPAVHGYLDTIRDGHPDTPLLLISPILCPIHEDAPGPSLPDPAALSRGELRFRAAGDPAGRVSGQLTLNTIREELQRIVTQRAASDPQLHYLDGRALYGAADAAHRPLPDHLHPDAASHRHIGARFAQLTGAWRGAPSDQVAPAIEPSRSDR